MATINIRNVPEDVYRALKVRAAENGESMEAYLRDSLPLLAEPRARHQMTLQEIRQQLRSALRADARHSFVDDFLEERQKDSGLENGTKS